MRTKDRQQMIALPTGDTSESRPAVRIIRIDLPVNDPVQSRNADRAEWPP
jgi:hypothetical protein